MPDSVIKVQVAALSSPGVTVTIAADTDRAPAETWRRYGRLAHTIARRILADLPPEMRREAQAQQPPADEGGQDQQQPA